MDQKATEKVIGIGLDYDGCLAFPLDLQARNASYIPNPFSVDYEAIVDPSLPLIQDISHLLNEQKPTIVKLFFRF